MPKLYATKNNKKKANHSLLIFLSWSSVIAFNVWIFWIIISPNKKGILGTFIFKNLFSFFGLSLYIFPFILLYGIIALFSKRDKPNKGILTLSLGIILTLSFFSSILELLRNKTNNIIFDGGWLGYFTETILSKIFGDIGSIIFSFLFFLIGIQIIFKISWTKLFIFLNRHLKNDYKQWISARNELSLKIKNLNTKKESEEKVIDLKPIPLTNTETILNPQQISNQKEIIIETEKKEEKEIKEESNKKENKEIKRKSLSEHLLFKDFKLPDINLLKPIENSSLIGPENTELQESKIKLEETFKNFEISAYVSGIYPGPVITRYEVTPSPGVKISSIVSLSNDIALAMKAKGIRVIAPIPGKAAIGFEIPNHKRAKVGLREILESPIFNSSKGQLTFALGRHADGSPAIANLETMPHLLVAGATGSGKSVFLQSLILSIIYRNTPDEVKFLFIDPKRLELTFYEAIPYLYDPRLTPDKVSVITDAKEASKSLVGLTKLMEKRYKKFEQARVKNIASYNKWALENKQPKEFYIIVVIDELADLMLQAKNVVEENIQRLAQMARAVGIHLVLATQRPSVDVITGVIKANLPSRVALQVTSKIDSRVIIDSPGAETLIGKGDLLYLGIEQQKPERIQGCYVSEEEIEKIALFIKEQGGPNYPLLQEEEFTQSLGKGSSSEELSQALQLILQRKRISQDLLKANFGSSARATNILSLLEVRGFIHKPEGTNRWEIYFDKIEGYLNSLNKEVK